MNRLVSFVVGFIAGVICLMALYRAGWLRPDRVSGMHPSTGTAERAGEHPSRTKSIPVPPADGKAVAESTRPADTARLPIPQIPQPGFGAPPQQMPGEIAPPISGIGLPIAGLKAQDVHDTFHEKRDGREHEATDILAPRGTPVLAVVDGVVKKLFTSQAGGLTIYEFDQPSVFCYYYAHLDRYADGLVEGQPLHRGDVIGYVGTTGNAPANTPHLHLAIFRLGPEKRWWEGTPIDPYPVLQRLLRQ